MKFIAPLALAAIVLSIATLASPLLADHAKNYCECIFHYRQPGWLTDPGYNPARIAACTKNFPDTKPASGQCPARKK